MVRRSSIKNHLTRVADHNTVNPNQRKSVRLTYHKLNGRVVKRKIDPLTIKDNLIVAYDHKRDALRSFKLERIKHMEKRAFWDGFNKQANHVAELAGLATLAAPSVQEMRGKHLSKKTKSGFELAGLGMLAAPSIAHYAKKLIKR